MAHEEQPSSAADQPAGWGGKKWLTLAALAGAFIAAYVVFGDALSLDYLAKQEAKLERFQQDHPVLIYAIAFSIYVVVTGLSVPGATMMTLMLGWYFQFLRGLVLVSFASTAGATLAFLLSRYLFRDVIQKKFADRLKVFNDALDREGAFYLFTLRLLPAVPFFVLNAVMGLTKIRTATFWWVSQLGMLPGTMVYVYAGSQVPDLQTLADQGAQAVFSPGQLAQLTIAFALLGLFPLVVKKILQRIRSRRELPSA